jgi:hypothetical protein
MDTSISEEYKPRQMRLREMPEDVRKILLQKQAEHKIKCNCHYSLEQTIYKLIRAAAKEQKE